MTGVDTPPPPQGSQAQKGKTETWGWAPLANVKNSMSFHYRAAMTFPLFYCLCCPQYRSRSVSALFIHSSNTRSYTEKVT